METEKTSVDDDLNKPFFTQRVEQETKDSGIIESDKVAEMLTDELAKMSRLEYGRYRKQAAKRLGITVTILDKIIEEKNRPTIKTEHQEVDHEEEPWSDPVSGENLFNTIYTNLTSHIILPPGAAVSITLWVILTYCYDAFLILPILALLSPEKRCGKTTLLSLLNGLVNCGRLSSNISSAAIYRVVEKYHPTLLTDEADTFLQGNEELRGIYNSGHTREAAFIDRVNKETLDVERFSTWAPKAIAMIGKPKDTILDRSIVVTMSRKKRGEKVEKKKLTHFEDSKSIRKMAMRWANDNIEELRTIEVNVPDLGNDRMEDNWTPILAIAEKIGGIIPDQAKEAMILLSGVHLEDESTGSMLLEDIKTIFEERDVIKLSSEEINNRLAEMDDRPWSEWRQGKPMTKPALARQLRKFGIKPKTIRIANTTAKGYEKSQFIDLFIRYVPPTPNQTVTTSQALKNKHLDKSQNVTNVNDVTDNCFAKQLKLGGCYVVTGGNAPKDWMKEKLEERPFITLPVYMMADVIY